MEWFKMQMIWGAAISRLSDSEAGRFIKAVYAFMRDGTMDYGNGKEDLLIAQALETLQNDMEKFEAETASKAASKAAISETRRRAAKARWMQNDAKDASACKCIPKNKNKNKNTESEPELEKRERKRFTPPTLEDVAEYCEERSSSVVPEKFVDFYTSKGWTVGKEPMRDWKAAVRTWERREKESVGYDLPL